MLETVKCSGNTIKTIWLLFTHSQRDMCEMEHFLSTWDLLSTRIVFKTQNYPLDIIFVFIDQICYQVSCLWVYLISIRRKVITSFGGIGGNRFGYYSNYIFPLSWRHWLYILGSRKEIRAYNPLMSHYFSK